jgi:hypothetical protein
MTSLTPSILATCCLLFSLTATADIIVLKNGEKLEGQIIREDEEKYVVEVKVSASIRDEKVIPRAEVDRIEKETEEEKAFRAIAHLAPAPELTAKEEYEARIEKLEEFVRTHPDSDRAGKVREMIDALGSELDVVSLGGIKIGEELIGADEYASNEYAYDARIWEKRIKDAASRGDFLGALRSFDAYETRFGDSEGRAGLTAFMLQVLGAYRDTVADSLASLDSRIHERELGLERMAAENRVKSERAIQEQMESLAKRFADEKAANMKWVTPDAFHKESLDETLRQITAEADRLGRPAETPETPLAEVYRDAWKKLSGGTDEEKKAVLEDAKAKKLPEYHLAKLRERANLPAE